MAGEDGAPEPEEPLVFGKLIISRPRPIKSRQLRLETHEKFGYGFSEAWNKETERVEKCHVAAFHDVDGNLVAQKLRFPNKVFSVRGNMNRAVLYGRHLWKPGPKRTVVITEGELDTHAMAQVQQLKWAVVSLKQGAKSISQLPAEVDWLDEFGRIVLMFDNDADGKEAALEAAALLPPGKVFIASLPLKDASDMVKAGRDDELVRAMWDAKAWRPDGLVFGQEALDLYLNRSMVESIPWSHPGLDDLMEGHRDGEIVIVCGATSSGKSTFVREEVIFMLPYIPEGERVGIIALEEPVFRQIQGFCSIYMEMPLHLRQCADVPDSEVVAVFNEHIGDSIIFDNHYGSLASEDLIQKMRYMARGLNVRRIILDHITIVVAGQDSGQDGDRKAIDKMMENLVSLTRETGVGIIAVCHLKRPKDGKGFEDGRQVHTSDLRGSSLLEALSNDIIAIEGDQQAQDPEEKNTRRVRSLKCRHTGGVGIAGLLRYYPDRCRLLPVRDEDGLEFEGEETDAQGKLETSDFT